MAFNILRRRPIEHGTIPQPIDVDFGWVAQGSLVSSIQAWSRYIYPPGLVASVGAGVASIYRSSAGNMTIYLPPDHCGEKLVKAWVDIICSTTGYVASYDAFIGSYIPPFIASGSYTGVQATNGQITIYTTTRGTSTLTDVSSLALASIRVNLRWSDADYG